MVTDELNAPNKFKINGEEYFCFFEISDSEIPSDIDAPEKADQGNKIRLTKSAIVNLDIRETLFEPFVSGHITLNNPFDYIDDNHYTTGDGSDYLHVILCEWKTYQKHKNQALKYTFVITDENNSVSKSDRSNNFKTYHLLDVNYNKLNTTIPSCIASDGYPKKPPAKVGDVIKEVLIDVLGVNVINKKLWWPGDHEIGAPNGEFASLIQKIPIALHWKYSDLLKYLLRINYSLGGEGLPVQSVLRFNRIDGKYSLEPIDMIFKDNKVLAKEAFGLGDLTSGTAKAGNKPTDLPNKNNPPDEKILINEYEGMLKNINLTTPMVSYGNEFFVNYAVCSDDSIGSSLDEIVVTLEEVIPTWKKAFVDVFKSAGGEVHPFIPLHEMRSDIMKPLSLPYDYNHVTNIAKAQIVSNLTFLNLQLTIDNEGDTFRSPGMFVDVFKLQEERASDTKILGRWLITKVHHRFFKDSYENVIHCAKTYVGPDSPENKLAAVTAMTDEEIGYEMDIADAEAKMEDAD